MLRNRLVLGCALREEDKFPRKLPAFDFGNPGLMEIAYGRKNLGAKDQGGMTGVEKT